jgi:opacity protein-like surface antigen
MIKQLLAAAAALALAAPVAAQAQEVPSYAAVQNDQQIQGRVTGFDGAYNLQVRDNNGYVDNVELHDGTIINPTGLALAPGMIVSILGDSAGPVFDANEIDTPYAFENAVPFYAGHPWDYYGPTISLGFFFGNTGWWHGASGRGYSHGIAYNVRSSRPVIVNNNYGRPDTHFSRPAPQLPIEHFTGIGNRFSDNHFASASRNQPAHVTERASHASPSRERR